MEVFTNREECARFLASAKAPGKTVGFVPTMGALHEGHLSLIGKARAENEIVAVSIYVNPTQFNNPADLEKYPRTPEADLEKLRRAGCDVVFAPTDDQMYPDGKKTLNLDLNGLDKEMEGKSRPGHFEGVITIVDALFRTIRPDNAYFGEKDFQQLAIIRYMAARLHPDIRIHGCPIFRQTDGLAMSSRNARLNPRQRQAAPLIYRTLKQAKALWGTQPIGEIIKFAVQNINADTELEVEYLVVADGQTMKPVASDDRIDPSKDYYAFAVVCAADVRLIDNIKLNR